MEVISDGPEIWAESSEDKIPRYVTTIKTDAQ